MWKEVNAQHLLNRLERALINAVNDVGVDINLAAAHTHRAAMLSFVAGLGPVKAHALQQVVSIQSLFNSTLR